MSLLKPLPLQKEDMLNAFRLGAQAAFTLRQLPLQGEGANLALNEAASRLINVPLNEITFRRMIALWGHDDNENGPSHQITYWQWLLETVAIAASAAFSVSLRFRLERGAPLPEEYMNWSRRHRRATEFEFKEKTQDKALSNRESILERFGERELKLALLREGDIRAKARADADRHERLLERGNIGLIGKPTKPDVERAAAPAAQPYGVAHEGAEALCAAWMRHLGVADAAVTRFSRDGGIDVDSLNFVAQVKNYSKKYVSVKEVRELFGVAKHCGKFPLLFTSSGLTTDAQDFASSASIATFRYDAMQGALIPLNRLAALAIRDGISRAPAEEADA
ncbi:restriction endonuclease [Microbacterium oryzae]|uniref:Restriction endonuclease n=1 Tax=Microbacterium oryzae TaxID=743009 RepID=A0A6I6E218_9MICO|nr:restriction endonuclease [Microbacterium oryzae]QGU28194.1 restriction endonuclease [Microbacterium oryzae]